MPTARFSSRRVAREAPRHAHAMPAKWRVRGQKDFRLVVKLDWASARKIVDYARENEMTLHYAIRDAVARLRGHKQSASASPFLVLLGPAVPGFG